MSDSPKFLQSWRVRGTLLGPLHIGTGEPLDPFRCVLDGDRLHEFDLTAALATAALAAADEVLRQCLFKRLSEPVDTNSAEEVRDLLTKTPWRSHIIRSYDLSADARQKLGRTRTWGTWEIQPFIHHPADGKRYIPGSSLKGALRTAVVSSRAAAIPPRFDREKSLEKRAEELEKQSLSYELMGEDPFSEWFVGDLFFAGNVCSCLYTINILNLMAKEGTGPPRPNKPIEFPNLVEAIIPAGEGPHFEGRITRRLKPHPGTGPPTIKRPVNIEELVKSAANHADNAFGRAFAHDQRSYLDGLPDETVEALVTIDEELKERNPLSCIVRLGRFGGFLSKTIEKHRILKEHTIRGRTARRELHGDEAKPNTRMLADDGKPFGFVKLTFDEV